MTVSCGKCGRTLLADNVAGPCPGCGSLDRRPHPQRRAMRTAGSGIASSGYDLDTDNILKLHTVGEPPSGEDDSDRGAQMVVGCLHLLGYPWDTTVHSGNVSHYREPERGVMEGLLDVSGPVRADAVAFGRGRPLPIQVTVANHTGKFWEGLRHSGRSDTNARSVPEPVEELWRAMQGKTKKGVPPGVLLVLNARQTAGYFAPGIVEAFRQTYARSACNLGWETIWLSAVNPAACARLDLEPGAVHGPIAGEYPAMGP